MINSDGLELDGENMKIFDGGFDKFINKAKSMVSKALADF